MRETDGGLRAELSLNYADLEPPPEFFTSHNVRDDETPYRVSHQNVINQDPRYIVNSSSKKNRIHYKTMNYDYYS